jgi:hypothetical protein
MTEVGLMWKITHIIEQYLEGIRILVLIPKVNKHKLY